MLSFDAIYHRPPGLYHHWCRGAPSRAVALKYFSHLHQLASTVSSFATASSAV
jgi:hypothetical protein